jgi:hypothetical protein
MLYSAIFLALTHYAEGYSNEHWMLRARQALDCAHPQVKEAWKLHLEAGGKFEIVAWQVRLKA